MNDTLDYVQLELELDVTTNCPFEWILQSFPAIDAFDLT